MKAKTYNDYYNILLKGCKEAFKAIELKEFLYTDEAMEDNKEYFISKESIEQIGINRSNNLIVNYQIEKDLKIDFIRFLDRQQQLFEKKHLIPRNEFYKKCLNALNIKLTELNKQEYRILSGISDMGTPPDPLLFLEYMKWDIKNKSLQTNETPEPQQTETVIPDEVKKEFKDFFNSDVNVNVIQSIQKEFKDYKGKKMAHLIYLLHKDFNIITYGINSRTESRKHFVSLLKGTDFRMAGIDKYFELSDVKLLNPKFESDPDYIDIKEKLLKTIK